MRSNQKIVITVMWGLAVLAMLGVVGTGLWASRAAALPVYYEAPAFSLTDQNGKAITGASMRGKVWVAMVFFTQCPDVCPMMIGRINLLQKSVALPDVRIVSFSIDPEHDTPEVLGKYADRIEADASRWHFLTGTKDEMFAVARGLNLAAMPAQDGKPITHAQKVLLIDRANRVRGIYSSDDEDSLKQLTLDAQALAADDAGSPL